MRQPSRQPSRHCTVELQALPARIGHVRRIISAQLRYWHLDALIDPAALGVTELLANVHRHARPSKRCSVELYALLGQLTVSVHDRDPRLPRVRAAESWETCGRGLALIAALSASWGMHPDADGGGKVVWFTLPAPTAAPGSPAAPWDAAGSAHWEPISLAPEPPRSAPPAPEPLRSAPLAPTPSVTASADPLSRIGDAKVG
ncbi:hypothetical protein B1H19_08545 [Streptomyces gilvosporeus]|uniref:Histidine kinase/HSP90-like ATPase domain-containing protein n=1 Tax=Streptomyces gilvosporeus TaxID=553510 RepID=A0A1V0U249_9ACTN|nr:hypothetical protein B1H19_08545 [Streptomyces gilvosporeus]